MRNIAILVGALSLVLAPFSARAGAWDLSAFGNDDALDWLQNEFEPGGANAIRRAIQAVLREGDYIELPAAASAVAACEMLAGWQGRPSPETPPPIVAMGKKLAGEPGEKLRDAARQALDRIVKSSELQELIAEGPASEYEAWRKAMADLRGRI